MQFSQNKTYMTAEDETEETIVLVAMLEGIPLNHLYESIDIHRSAGCGFARAARIFATNYLRAFIEDQKSGVIERYNNALSLQKAMMAVANDSGTD